MVEPEVIEKVLEKLGNGKTDKAVPSNKMMASKEYLECVSEYKEPVKAKKGSTTKANVEVEELKREISMTKKELGKHKKEIEELKTDIAIMKIALGLGE
jgi:peptidoglycan hydrolase CwlO-like protein